MAKVRLPWFVDFDYTFNGPKDYRKYLNTFGVRHRWSFKDENYYTFSGPEKNLVKFFNEEIRRSGGKVKAKTLKEVKEIWVKSQKDRNKELEKRGIEVDKVDPNDFQITPSKPEFIQKNKPKKFRR